MLRLFARRELSERQARERLASRQFSQDSIDQAIAALADERVIDDERVARARARLEIELRGRGPARAVQQIENLGIARALARRVVAELTDAVDTTAAIERALTRRLRPGEPIPDRATFARLYRFLVGQGFASEDVVRTLERRARNQEDG